MTVPLPGRILPLSWETFRALGKRDFRLLWIGQAVSLTGTWMQSVAQGWLVLRLTDSPLFLGLVGFSSYVPVLLFALPAGVLADRVRRRRALMVTQSVAMATALTLALLTWSERIGVWHVVALAFALGTSAAFDIPIRQSLLQDLVGRENLQNAIALNSLTFNGARLVGPAIAGLLLARFGEALCFFLNAISFSAVLIGLLLMRSPQHRLPRTAESWIGDARRGVAYAVGHRRVRALLGLVIVSSVFGAPYAILMPVFARDVLEVGSRGLGLLMGAAGLGATLAALRLAGRRSSRGSGALVAGSMAILGAGLIGFALSRRFELSLLLLVAVGGAMLVQLATSNTLLQLTAPPGMRGRIVSLYMLCFIGMSPLGSLLAGVVARLAGAPAAVIGGGAICLVAALAFATRIPALRDSDPPAAS